MSMIKRYITIPLQQTSVQIHRVCCALTLCGEGGEALRCDSEQYHTQLTQQESLIISRINVTVSQFRNKLLSVPLIYFILIILIGNNFSYIFFSERFTRNIF